MKNKFLKLSVIAALSGSLVGCSSLPGDAGTQGAVIGGVGGAATGAAVSENRGMGALIGGAIGAAGGYLIGANKDKIMGNDNEGAQEAVQKAQNDPATAQDALRASTADLNKDGFVTLDEVVALEEAGLEDEVILQRLKATNQVFELTPEQEAQLRQRGVSENVIEQLSDINQGIKEADDEIISGGVRDDTLID